MEDFKYYEHFFHRTEIDQRKYDSLLLRFSEAFKEKMRYSNNHNQVFKALHHDCDVYRILEQVLDMQLETQELFTELVMWSHPSALEKAKSELNRKNSLKQNITLNKQQHGN